MLKQVSVRIPFLSVLSFLIMLPLVHAEPAIQVVPEVFDFGTVEQGDLAIARFRLENPGSQTVMAQWMEFSQPGIIAQVSSTISAGSFVEVLVNWNTTGLLGDIEGKVNLGLDSPGDSEVVFVLRGHVVLPKSETEN